MSSNAFVLRPNKQPPNWLEKFYEWRDLVNAQVDWSEEQVGRTYRLTPILNGTLMGDCTGSGMTKQGARDEAAKLLSDKGKLYRR